MRLANSTPPDARSLGGVIIVGFFIFWIVFVFMFGRRVPKPDRNRQDQDLGESGYQLAFRRWRRRDSDDDGHGDDGGGGDGD